MDGAQLFRLDLTQTVDGLAHHVEDASQHLFTHRKLSLEVFRARLSPGGRVKRSGYTAHKWVAPEAALELAHAGPMRKAMTLLGVTDETSARAARKRAK